MASGTTQRSSTSQRGEKDLDSESVFQYGFRMNTANQLTPTIFWRPARLGVRRGFESRLRRLILFYCSELPERPIGAPWKGDGRESGTRVRISNSLPREDYRDLRICFSSSLLCCLLSCCTNAAAFSIS